MSEKIGYGVIGAGNIGGLHARVIASLPNAKLAAIFDVNPEAAEKFAAQYQCKAYHDMTAFLADSEVQAVTIATPSGLHGKMAIASANAGKHVFEE